MVSRAPAARPEGAVRALVLGRDMQRDRKAVYRYVIALEEERAELGRELRLEREKREREQAKGGPVARAVRDTIGVWSFLGGMAVGMIGAAVIELLTSKGGG